MANTVFIVMLMCFRDTATCHESHLKEPHNDMSACKEAVKLTHKGMRDDGSVLLAIRCEYENSQPSYSMKLIPGPRTENK